MKKTNKFKFYSDWHRERFDNSIPCINYIKQLDIFNKKIRHIKLLGKDDYISKQLFIDEYNNYQKVFVKKVSLNDFPNNYEMPKTIMTSDPFYIEFEDNLTLDIWPIDFGVIEISNNSLKNYKSYVKSNIDENKMLKEALGKKIIDVSYIPIKKKSQMFKYAINKKVEEPIQFIILRLNDDNNIIISTYGLIFIGNLEEGPIRVPMKEYLNCIDNYEQYFN